MASLRLLTALRRPNGEAPWGVNVAGFLRSELGLGEAARGVIAALDVSGVPLMPVHGSYAPNSRQAHPFVSVRPEHAPFPINLICINPEELPMFLADAGPGFVEQRYTIGFWWWEVSLFPERWLSAFELVDEVWVGSEHVARTLRAISPVPVTQVRTPVTVSATPELSRQALGLPDDFLFTFLFDFHSAFERKNPLAVVEAFKRAFAPNSGASLVIKCINHGSDPHNYARLLTAAADHPSVHILDRYLSSAEKNALIASSDCYVSLHRAEGFALTAAEALYFGRPVVATGYSGNLEFMDDENSYLVDYAMVPIGEGNSPYPADGEWADPDVDHAAELMRRVFDDPAEASRRAARAAAELRRSFSLEATGEIMARRLREIGDAARLPSKREPSAPERRKLPRRDRLQPLRWISLRQGFDAIRSDSTSRRRLGIGIVRSIYELAGELRRRVRSRRETLTVGNHGEGVQVAGLLSELRRQHAELQELETRVTALEQQQPRR